MMLACVEKPVVAPQSRSNTTTLYFVPGMDVEDISLFAHIVSADHQKSPKTIKMTITANPMKIPAVFL